MKKVLAALALLGKLALGLVITGVFIVLLGVAGNYLIVKMVGSATSLEHVRNPPIENRLQ